MIANIPLAIKLLYPKRIWNQGRESKNIYLTFDDGPIPEITPWVLKQLEDYSAKATFFCIGDNIRKYPEIFEEVVKAGHTIGNHTFNHLNGWKTSTEEYLRNVFEAESLITIKNCRDGKPKLFRPPYGRLTRSQARGLLVEDYKIMMWDVLSRDYDQGLSEEACYKSVLRNTRPGSIIVFHDSIKAEKNVKSVLPRVLDYYSRKGYTFLSL